MFRNLFLMLGIVFAIGCSETPLDQILTESSQPTSEIANELAACYQSLDATSESYSLTFDKECIDNLIIRDTGEYIHKVSIIDLNINPDNYVNKLIEIEAFVILASNGSTGNGILAISDFPSGEGPPELLITDYLFTIWGKIPDAFSYLIEGNKYRFLIRVSQEPAVTGNGTVVIGYLKEDPILL